MHQAHLPTENRTTILCLKLRSSRIVTTLLSSVATKNAKKRMKTTKKVAMSVKKTPLSAIPWTKWTLKNQWSTILPNVTSPIQWDHHYPQLHTLQSLVFLTAHLLPSTANHPPPRNDIPIRGKIRESSLHVGYIYFHVIVLVFLKPNIIKILVLFPFLKALKIFLGKLYFFLQISHICITNKKETKQRSQHLKVDLFILFWSLKLVSLPHSLLWYSIYWNRATGIMASLSIQKQNQKKLDCPC